jgi:hypothetical protein
MQDEGHRSHTVMARRGHVGETLLSGYFPRQSTHPPEVRNPMPQALIVIFLLFFAVLAFGWFYWQRAKARAAANTSSTESTEQSS